MLNISRTSVLASCLACLTIASASIALGKDEPTPSTQQNQDHQQAQANQPTQPSGPQLEAKSDEQNQQPNQSDVSRDAKQSTDVQQPQHDQTNRAQNGNVQDGPNSKHYDIYRAGPNNQSSRLRTPDRQQSRGQQGASLGVNITSSGQGVVVTRVQADTPAQQMGLRPSDRIISVNGAPAGSADEFISTIRGMNPGDQVELQIVRDGNEQSIRGELEAYGQALVRNEQPTGNDEFRSYRRTIGQNQWAPEPPTIVSRDAERSSEPSAPRFSDADRSANLQTSYEERSSSTRPQSGDIDARLSRIEQQIDRLTQAVEEIRNTIGTAPLTDRPTSGLREAASAEFRATNPTTRTQPRPNPPLQNGEVLKRNDRWNIENRFEQGDLPGARERATAEAARRRANQTGTQLQQQERERAANAKQAGPANPNTEQPPQPTATDQPTSEKPK